MKKKSTPTEAQITYGYNFRNERLNLGLSQENIAKAANTSKSFISLLERAKTSISIKKAEELSLFFFNKPLVEMLKKKPKNLEKAQDNLPSGRMTTKRKKTLLNK